MALLTKCPLGWAIALYVQFTESVYPNWYLQIILHNFIVYSIIYISFSDINFVVNNLLVSEYQLDKTIVLKLYLIEDILIIAGHILVPKTL